MSKSGHTRTQTLEEAANLASLLGLNGLSIGGPASHMSRSKSGLFRHSGSKERLKVDTLRAGLDRFTEVVVRPALEAPSSSGLEGGCRVIAASMALFERLIHGARAGTVTAEGTA